MPNVKMERYSVIGEMVMASPNPIPPNATLLDNGASVNVMKTLKGAILSTYVPQPGYYEIPQYKFVDAEQR